MASFRAHLMAPGIAAPIQAWCVVEGLKPEVWFESRNCNSCPSPGCHSRDGQLFNSLDSRAGWRDMEGAGRGRGEERALGAVRLKQCCLLRLSRAPRTLSPRPPRENWVPLTSWLPCVKLAWKALTCSITFSRHLPKAAD